MNPPNRLRLDYFAGEIMYRLDPSVDGLFHQTILIKFYLTFIVILIPSNNRSGLVLS